MSLVINDYEAFCLVQDHLLNQKEPAKDTNDDCQYRGYKQSTLANAKDKAEDLIMDSTEEYDDDVIFHKMFEILEEEFPDAKCAVGCLISDDFYSQDFEGRTIERSCHVWDAVKHSNPLWHMNDASHEMLKKLQAVHDNNHPEDWETLLSRFSTSFDKYGDYEIEKENE
jgi:hypothetical protein